MTVRVGINGFGRIGRSFERVVLHRGADAGISVAAVNEPNADADTLAFLLQYDSVGGALGADVEATGSGLRVDGHEGAGLLSPTTTLRMPSWYPPVGAKTSQARAGSSPGGRVALIVPR